MRIRLNNIDLDVCRVVADSRAVKPGDLFVAIKGTQVNGHDYIGKAIARGAIAVVCEQTTADQRINVPIIIVKDSARALGELTSQLHGDPSKSMKVIGVTGTNGKTTIATLLYHMFKRMGHKVGLVSTVCNFIDDRPVPTNKTTPDSPELQTLFAQMRDANCSYVFMEVSSHAVDQQRIAGIEFDGAIFTNLTRDHLDYHGTVENYLKAKKRFFDDLNPGAFALSNLDDRVGEVMMQNCRANCHGYSLQVDADFRAKILEQQLGGTSLLIDGLEVMTPFVGRFNVYNLLAVYGASRLLGKERDETLLALSQMIPVTGRFETIHSNDGITAIVDYAHTPDALTNVLKTISDVLRHSNGHVITVVGCGGNRDKGKRPIMAREAIRLSHQVILTSDNPRNENPEEIIRDMEAGLDSSMLQQSLSIVDRRQAIRTALRLAQSGDVVLIAGKGHEDYQEIQGVKHHFDDREEVRIIMNKEK